MNGEEPLERIEETGIDEEMRSSYIDYSMSVIVGRALPDVRDGLKPVHRRVLFAMRELSNTHNRPYKKSARIVGDVIGKYHPHGDMAVYDTIVRLAQGFSMRYPLVDGQGNFGSIDGDPPAAMRYTEIRMDKMAEELLADIDKDTVDFGPNYDETLEQPLVMPSRFPNLLVNGSTGIAVGMATNIPPHNLNEVIDALIHLIENPRLQAKDLMQFVKGPDFPTGGIICGMKPIQDMYTTGRGQLKVRGRAFVEEGKNGRERIIISEIPYIVNKAKLIENIARLVHEKTLEGISDIRDESNKEGIRVVIELRKNAAGNVILNKLYKLTQMETTFGAILLALDDGKPLVMNLKEMLQKYLAHRLEVIKRRSEYELRKAEARAHVLEGLKIALDNLDEVVKTIRSANSRDEAKEKLKTKFGLTEIQAKAILDMRLYQLTGLEREKVENEYLELIKYISYLNELLASESKMFDLVKEELVEIKNTYGDQRRTDIAPDEGEINMEDLIANRGCIITVSHNGYIKRVPTGTYRSQKRGGKGVAGMATREEDFVEHVFTANTHDYLLFFTEKGMVYWKKVYELPEAARTARGKAIVNILNIRKDDSIASLIRINEFSDKKHLLMATRNGIVKKTNLSAFKNPRRDGVIGIKVDNDDKLIGVKLTDGNNEAMLATVRGMSIRFKETELRDMGRATRGVKGITLSKEDFVKTMEIVNTDASFLICTTKGYGKRTLFDEYRLQKRGGKGIIAMRLSEKNGEVVGAHAVCETETLMLITAKGKMIRFEALDVRIIGRTTQGVRLINLEENDKLVSATPLEPDPEDETEKHQAE